MPLATVKIPDKISPVLPSRGLWTPLPFRNHCAQCIVSLLSLPPGAMTRHHRRTDSHRDLDFQRPPAARGKSPKAQGVPEREPLNACLLMWDPASQHWHSAYLGVPQPCLISARTHCRDKSAGPPFTHTRRTFERQDPLRSGTTSSHPPL
jgi:hypothetical protein